MFVKVVLGRRKSTFIVLAIFLILNLILFTRKGVNYYKIRSIVEKKDQLLGFDISRSLRYQKSDFKGFSDELRSANFLRKNYVGYTPNLNTTNFSEIDAVTCSDMEYTSQVDNLILTNNFKTNINLKAIREFLVNSNHPYGKFFTESKETQMDENDILNKRWKVLDTVAIWLEDSQCFIAYTNILYSSKENPKDSSTSVVYAQAYDVNWNYLPEKRIPYKDMAMPPKVDKYLKKLQDKLENKNCDKFVKDQAKYDKCITKNVAKRPNIEDKIKSVFQKYTVQYPQIVNMPFENFDKWRGFENLRVIVRNDQEGDEPLLVFQEVNKNKDRKIRGFLPHRKYDPNVHFKFPQMNVKLGLKEVNWSPFFFENNNEDSTKTLGDLHFIYDYDSLEILRCSLDKSRCKSVFQTESKISERNNTNVIRGGTQFVPLPKILPKLKNKNMWLGFPQTSQKDCGCGSKFERPALTLLVEENGKYNLELISTGIDFDIEVLNGNDRTNQKKTTQCEGDSSLTLKSITNWAVLGQDPITLEYEDYLTLVSSEADSVSKQIVVRGVLNYILRIYKDYKIAESFKVDKASKSLIQKANQCLDKSLLDGCVNYGAKHSVNAKNSEEQDKNKQ